MNKSMTMILGLVLSGSMLAMPVCAGEPNIAIVDDNTSYDGNSTDNDYGWDDADEGSFVYYGPYDMSDRVYETGNSTYPLLLTKHHYQNEWSDTYGIATDYASWETLQLENADSYGALGEALLQMEETERAEAESRLKELADWAAEDLSARGDANDFWPYSYTAEISVRRADARYMSLVYTKSMYNGGPHGNTWYTSCTFDSATGRQLLLSDIVTDTQQLLSEIRAALKLRYPELSGLQDDADYDYWGDVTVDNLVWTLENGSITFYFEPYRLGYYAEGAQFVSLAIGDYSALFTDAVKTVEEGGVTQMLAGVPACVDLDADGSPDTIEVNRVYRENDYESGIAVTVNGQEAAEMDAYFYDYTAWILRHEGNTYLYVFTTSDNDYQQLMVFALTSGGAHYVDTVDYGRMGWYGEDSDSSYTELITDPGRFRLTKRTHVLGTASVFAVFTPGEDGLPAAQTEELYETTKPRLKTKQDISGTAVDYTSGQAVLTDQQAVIPSGQMVTVIATDTQSYADICSDEGVYLRIPMEVDGYPLTSGGVDTDELFEGIMYAG